MMAGPRIRVNRVLEHEGPNSYVEAACAFASQCKDDVAQAEATSSTATASHRDAD